MSARKPTGHILYQGPSMLDGAPIVAIATTSSANSKTGAMVQTWIIRADVEPHTALKTGQDASVCGDCQHRPANNGACYVTVFQAPLSVYRAFKRGRYPTASDPSTIGAGRVVRLGSYGDPAAVPAHVWESFVSRAAGHTGYTHQWRSPSFDPAIARLCMASADSPAEATEAARAGLRYFRIRTASEPLATNEFACPASPEAGQRKTCATCKACDGSSRTGKASPVIIVHGAKARNFQAVA